MINTHVRNDYLIESLTNVFSQTQSAHLSTFVIVDIDIDMLETPKQCQNCMQIYCPETGKTWPQCFKAKSVALSDILTDTSCRIKRITNFGIGLSGFHTITCAITILFSPKRPVRSFLIIGGIQILTILNSNIFKEYNSA